MHRICRRAQPLSDTVAEFQPPQEELPLPAIHSTGGRPPGAFFRSGIAGGFAGNPDFYYVRSNRSHRATLLSSAGIAGKKLGSIGNGIPGVKLQVVDESGKEVSTGGVGEIVAEGENITQGYWRDPEESAKSFRHGRLYTGDIATVDEDGFIYVVDRDKDFLKCGGKRISCRQVEDRLLGFKGVLEAAVIGVPDDVLGEAVKAFVVPANGDFAGLAERLRLFCKERIPPPLVPKEIVVLQGLPKNSAGKVLKRYLGTP